MELTKQELKRRVAISGARAMLILEALTPQRSRNMFFNWTIEYTDGGMGFELKNDTYYLIYTNEKWISPRWRGRENPRYHWLQRARTAIAESTARVMGGTLYES